MTRVTMRFSVVDHVLVAVHGPMDPSTEDWQRYLQLYAENPARVRANLVVTAGGGPSARQRAEMARLPNVASLNTAVVSDSMFVRGIVTAIAWFGKPIRAFSSPEMELALHYLEISPDTKARVLLELAAMRKELAIEQTPPVDAEGK